MAGTVLSIGTPLPNGSSFLYRVDATLLLSLSRLYLATAEQLTRLHYSAGSLTYTRARLRRLEERGQVLVRSLYPGGFGANLYRLSAAGWKAAASLGRTPPPRFRECEQADQGYLHLSHTLRVNDFLVAVMKAAADSADVRLAELRHEQELKRSPLWVTLSTTRRGVVFDGWLDLRLPRNKRACVALELDMGTMERRAFQDKVVRILAAARGAYQEAFRTTSLTVAVVTPRGEEHARQLQRWSEAVLKPDAEKLSGIFCFAGIDSRYLAPAEVLFSPLFTRAFDPIPVSLVPPSSEEAPRK